MREDPPCSTDRTAPVRVGDAVFLEGTGRWWAGFTFRAVVADVRTSDGTIKVRYADGGYKRLSRAEFAALVKRFDDLPGARDVDVAPLPLDMFDDADFSHRGPRSSGRGTWKRPGCGMRSAGRTRAPKPPVASCRR
ncbi:unnamed protein product [Prorocentrum cordatum]|uniref:Uncharacterized protein n=1 Tax=Prorocentrum cordatum TaxID=2364126 RepID=A0ABN9W153_9DINO|nr:unnamed protein product [Polarella glacialis]